MKRRIAIICGGNSSEYAVSMRSADGLYSFFDKDKYDVHIVEMRRNDWFVHLDTGTARVDLNDFSYTIAHVKHTFDYAYITIHGAPGENGELQGYFEMLGMPYSTCGVLIAALTFNKYFLNNYLRAFGINVARSILIRAGEERPTDEEIVRQIGLPCFVKPSCEGSSYGVSKVKKIGELPSAIAFAQKQSDEIMIEEFLDGVEIAQGAYSKKGEIVVLPPTEVVTDNEFFDYDAKYNGQVDEITPARINPSTAEQVALITRNTYELLHCKGIVRMDYIITKDAHGADKINMLEINTTPGMTTTSFIPQQVRAAGMDISQVLSDVVEDAF